MKGSPTKTTNKDKGPVTLSSKGALDLTNLPKGSIPMQVHGVGYRVRYTDPTRAQDPREIAKGVSLTFDLGRSHPIVKRVHPDVQVRRDATGSSFVLVPGPSWRKDPNRKRDLGHVADHLRKRRPRCAYTGVGILRGDRPYPPMKSTKKTVKKS
jgi:hypothetical protein